MLRNKSIFVFLISTALSEGLRAGSRSSANSAIGVQPSKSNAFAGGVSVSGPIKAKLGNLGRSKMYNLIAGGGSSLNAPIGCLG